MSSKKLFNGGDFTQAEHEKVKETCCKSIKAINPRQLSFFILNQYFSEKSNLKFLLNKSLKNYDLSELDRRFIFEVVKGTVRYTIRVDFLISLFSNKKVLHIDKDVLNILRQAVYQLLFMDKIPAYAAINESVEIAKKYIGIYSSRFVNAVLRKINVAIDNPDFLDSSIESTYDKPAERLSVMYSYPEWIADYWIKSFGIDRTALLFNSLNQEPLVFIRVNRLKTSKKDLLSSFMESGMVQNHDFFQETQGTFGSYGTADRLGNIQKTGLFDDCIILKSIQNIEKIPGFLNGDFSVQDFSSQFAIKYFLEPARHDKILDLCGAPGGKATYAAELTEGEAEVVSVDINKKKMDLFEKNAERLGIKNISFVNADATVLDFLGEDRYVNYFDKIFIDAPCSALGTISKNPDVKYAGTLSDVERLAEISAKILSASDKYLKPGGKIILYKCTLSKIENQQSVQRFIEQNHGKYLIDYPYSGFTDISGSNDILKEKSAKVQDHNLKKANMSQLESLFKPLFEKNPLFEIMPDYFLSEAGFVCRLKKSA